MTPAIVAKGDTVSVDYTGRLENGTVFDSSSGRAPLEFTAGGGQMIAGFDAAVIGMHLNETKTVTIPPEQAYGMPRSDLIFDVPIANIPNGTKVGSTLYANMQQFTVVSINKTAAVLDGNHPLAGKTLIFDIKIVGIQKKA